MNSIARKESGGRETARKKKQNSGQQIARKAREQANQKLALAPISKPDDVAQNGVTDQTELIRTIQKELLRVACYMGKIDGQWSRPAEGALQDFVRRTKISPASTPTTSVLAAIEAKKGRVCPLICGANEKPVGEKCIAAAVPKRPVALTSRSKSQGL